MKVIINSDVIFTTYLVKEKLPPSLFKLCLECVRSNHEIVIPQTALLEFDRYQKIALDKEIKRLNAAYGTLEEFGIKYTRVDPYEILKTPNLISLIRATGVKVEVEHPLIEDFEEAHRRACLHLPPQPPDTDNDEMRDLVIWMIALRLAKQNQGAVLISRDVVHTHARGDFEAIEVNLERFDKSGGDTRILWRANAFW